MRLRRFRRSMFSEGDGSRAGASPFRVAVPTIDLEEIERHARARESTFRASAPLAPNDERRRVLRDILADIEARLAVAALRAAPRYDVPSRLRWLGPAGALALRAYNYFSKASREAIVEQNLALASLVAVLRMTIGAYDD